MIQYDFEEGGIFMVKKTYEEKLSDIEAKKNKLNQQLKKLKSEQAKKERNARTKRLIEVGAIVEKAIGIELDTPEQKEKLMAILTQEHTNKNGAKYSYASYFRKLLERTDKKPQ